MSVAKGLGVGVVSLAAAFSAASPPPVERGEKTWEFRIGEGAFLGVRLQDVEADDVERLKLPGERGALVVEVEDATPAARAGLQKGDVVVSFEGETVRSAAQLARLVRETPAGRKVSIGVSRDGVPRALSATLERGTRGLFDHHLRVDLPELPEVPEPPDPALPPLVPLDEDDHHFAWRFPREMHRFGDFLFRSGEPRKLGISYQEVSGQLAAYFQAPGGRGILVTEVEEGGPASQAGIKAGDLIVEFAGQQIENSEDLRRHVRRAEPGQETAVVVRRAGSRLDLKLKVGGEKEKKTVRARDRSV